jgi:hypothetical protein
MNPATSSQQVSWWSVYEYVAARVQQVKQWPLVGTPAWCLLDDDDPVKTAAVFDAAQHFALRVETCQQQRCDAAHELSAAADWRAIATEVARHREVYIPREVA